MAVEILDIIKFFVILAPRITLKPSVTLKSQGLWRIQLYITCENSISKEMIELMNCLTRPGIQIIQYLDSKLMKENLLGNL